MAKRRKDGEERESGKEERDGGYEQMREKRMRENMERMHKLGIMDLAKTLKKPSPNPNNKRIKRQPSRKNTPSDPPRRSSRLVTLAPIRYSEKRVKEEKVKIVKIYIPEGSRPEMYTKEDEDLLGDCKEAWSLCVDGYSEDGERIYDPFHGKSCHQCRQKTLGHRTRCIKCKSVQGQFCGDCLYTRYGENVLEANQNTDWICPVCRGICNCSRCRRVKGWAPTGQLYTKVKKLGFKSVAHFLIKTRRPGSDLEKIDAELLALEADTNPGEMRNPQTVQKGDVPKDADDDYNEEADSNLDSDSGSDGDTDNAN